MKVKTKNYDFLGLFNCPILGHPTSRTFMKRVSFINYFLTIRRLYNNIRERRGQEMNCKKDGFEKYISKNMSRDRRVREQK